ncbi:MAG: glycosyltransferase family 61 protein [Bacteroidia bacterium]|nr:glycosyltransferase family 61 protein [Bacteroidia bacterium]
MLFDFWSANNYYHWLIDALPRLLMILKEFNNSNYTLVLPKKASRFVNDTLRLYNVTNISFIENDTYLSNANILMPDYAAGSGHIHPTFVNEVRRKLMESVAGTGKHERIYVSRSKQKARRIVNEAEVIEILKQHNFQILYFENLSFEEQVLLVKNARYYVSSHGANMTNLMFMKDEAGVLELIREDSPNFCYWALSDVCKMNYYYQLCAIAEKDHLFVNLSELKENLKLLLNE